MHTYWKWLIGLVALFVVVVVATGAFLIGQMLARPAFSAGPGVEGYGWPGAGMMGRGVVGGWGMMGGCTEAGAVGLESCPLWGGGGWGQAVPPAGGTLTLEQARQAVDRYVAAWSNPDLAVHEIMEFEQNFYAIVEEKSTGVGAFEVLVDKWTGAVGPEPGPNMMWNARYGMMGGGGMMGGRGMMGGYGSGTGSMRLSPEEAARIAQTWLDQNLPGVQAHADDVDPFYGYYTLHVWKDGRIYGMLSVHGETGAVWYHTWHGAFIAMLEEGH